MLQLPYMGVAVRGVWTAERGAGRRLHLRREAGHPEYGRMARIERGRREVNNPDLSSAMRLEPKMVHQELRSRTICRTHP